MNLVRRAPAKYWHAVLIQHMEVTYLPLGITRKDKRICSSIWKLPRTRLPNGLTITRALSRLLFVRSPNEQQQPLNSSAYQELQLLAEVQETPDITQRQLSWRIGIALGLTNVLLRNFIQKGYVRVSSATWKRRLYSLTPEGIAHKLHLTVAYIDRVLNHYQSVRQTLREEMETLAVNAESRVAILGTGEFAEVVFLGLREIGIEEIEMFASTIPAGGRFLGMPVHDSATISTEQYDRILIASLQGSEEVSSELLALGAPPDKIVTFFAGDSGRKG
jgi:DNA-binding MarR family transcriptional regulator